MHCISSQDRIIPLKPLRNDHVIKELEGEKPDATVGRPCTRSGRKPHKQVERIQHEAPSTLRVCTAEKVCTAESAEPQRTHLRCLFGWFLDVRARLSVPQSICRSKLRVLTEMTEILIREFCWSYEIRSMMMKQAGRKNANQDSERVKTRQPGQHVTNLEVCQEAKCAMGYIE